MKLPTLAILSLGAALATNLFWPAGSSPNMPVSRLAGDTGTHTDEIVTPKEYRRMGDQTFLTFPEWFLVFSSAEFADLTQQNAPSEFPYGAHILQFWQGYRNVYVATKGRFPFNSEYNTMIAVIGASTTFEYAIKALYESSVGQFAWQTASHGLTQEDHYGAKVAQEYVHFIRQAPWYEFNYTEKLHGLWNETDWFGPDMLRKWERKYFLTTEYGAKAVYGWAIEKLCRASYDVPKLETVVLAEHVDEAKLVMSPDFKILQRYGNGRMLISLPRYEAFMDASTRLTKSGAKFVEIAGNRGAILVSVIAPADWLPYDSGFTVLFTQPIITHPGKTRMVFAVPVGQLSGFLDLTQQNNFFIEHIFDF